MDKIKTKILRIDGFGGLIVGMLVLSFPSFLSALWYSCGYCENDGDYKLGLWFILGEKMTFLGQIVVLGEGSYVGVLACLEWFWRSSLVRSSCEISTQN